MREKTRHCATFPGSCAKRRVIAGHVASALQISTRGCGYLHGNPHPPAGTALSPRGDAVSQETWPLWRGTPRIGELTPKHAVRPDWKLCRLTSNNPGTRHQPRNHHGQNANNNTPHTKLHLTTWRKYSQRAGKNPTPSPHESLLACKNPHALRATHNKPNMHTDNRDCVDTIHTTLDRRR